MNKLFVATVALIAIHAWAPQAQAVTLEESLKHALSSNVTDQLSSSRIEQNVEFKKEGQSTYLPSLRFRATHAKQDNYESGQTLGINLTQSIYNGGRDRLTVKNRETGIQIARNQAVVDRRNLYLDVIQSYYTYFSNINDLKNIELLRKQSNDRTVEIRKRVQIGRSRNGELLQAEAQLAAADALWYNGTGLVKASSADFVVLTGLDANELPEVDLQAISGNIVVQRTVDDYINLALQQEDVVNRRLNVEQADRNVSISKRHYLPTLDLTSNYYFNRYGSNRLVRDSDWDLGLVFVLPFYDGGFSQARVREEVAIKTESALELNDYERRIKSEVSNRYETFRRYYDQIKSFDIALDKAKRSYEENVKDYRLGLVSNLDVLTSLNTYLENKRNAEQNRIQALLTKKQLDAVVGEIK